METKSTLEFGRRAKTIKNTVIVNEVLTAEEWKRRYEKEKDRTARLKNKLKQIENELSRWRGGEEVPRNEQLNLQELDVSNLSESVQNLSVLKASPFGDLSASAMASPIAHGERMKYEEEKTRLFAQLDEKDDEIARQSSIIERWKQQMQEQEELLRITKRQYESSEEKMKSIQSDSKTKKEEVNNLLVALQELAQNFDEKEAQLLEKGQQIEALNRDLTTRTMSLNTLQAELEQTKEASTVQLKRLSEMLTNFLKELNEIASVLGTPPATVSTTSQQTIQQSSTQEISNKLEDEFTVARLYINKMKSEVKTVVAKCQHLDLSNSESTKKLQLYERELDESKLLITQHEAKMATLQASMKDIENKKRSLEEMVDHLNEECSKLKAQEEMHIMTSKEREKEKDSAEQIKSALETQIEKHREAHQKQLSALRDEISEKENAIEQLKDVNQKFLLAQEKNQIDLDKLREELNEKTAKVEELSMSNNRREQAQEDLRGLEETVARELQTLNRLRKMFVQDLLSRVRRSAAGQEDTEIGGSQIQQHKIQFLENNLDKLTYIHKQLVTENSELRREKPKLKKHIELLMGRIKDLENDLCRTKELANEEKRRYQRESDRINEAVRQRNLMVNGHAQIAKPIRAGKPGNVHRPVVTPGPSNK